MSAMRLKLARGSAARNLLFKDYVSRVSEKGEQSFDLTKNVTRLAVQPGQVILDIRVHPDGTPKPHEVVASVFGLPLESARELPADRVDVRLSPPPTLGSRERGLYERVCC